MGNLLKLFINNVMAPSLVSMHCFICLDGTVTGKREGKRKRIVRSGNEMCGKLFNLDSPLLIIVHGIVINRNFSF